MHFTAGFQNLSYVAIKLLVCIHTVGRIFFKSTRHNTVKTTEIKGQHNSLLTGYWILEYSGYDGPRLRFWRPLPVCPTKLQCPNVKHEKHVWVEHNNCVYAFLQKLFSENKKHYATLRIFFLYMQNIKIKSILQSKGKGEESSAWLGRSKDSSGVQSHPVRGAGGRGEGVFRRWNRWVFRLQHNTNRRNK